MFTSCRNVTENQIENIDRSDTLLCANFVSETFDILKVRNKNIKLIIILLEC